MTPYKLAFFVVFSTLLCGPGPLLSQELDSTFTRDPNQPIDKQYSDQIR
jgi:hypothetical protein